MPCVLRPSWSLSCAFLYLRTCVGFCSLPSQSRRTWFGLARFLLSVAFVALVLARSRHVDLQCIRTALPDVISCASLFDIKIFTTCQTNSASGTTTYVSCFDVKSSVSSRVPLLLAEWLAPTAAANLVVDVDCKTCQLIFSAVYTCRRALLLLKLCLPSSQSNAPATSPTPSYCSHLLLPRASKCCVRFIRTFLPGLCRHLRFAPKSDQIFRSDVSIPSASLPEILASNASLSPVGHWRPHEVRQVPNRTSASVDRRRSTAGSATWNDFSSAILRPDDINHA